MDIKDRIKLVMEDRHMNQQAFAEFIQQTPGTLSSIYTGRTRPTLNILDSIKKKIPEISIEWLMYGNGTMYITHPDEAVASVPESVGQSSEPMINFDDTPQNVSPSPMTIAPVYAHQQGVRNAPPEKVREEVKIVDKEPRHVTEIRVYYDDQTYETFVPSKK